VGWDGLSEVQWERSEFRGGGTDSVRDGSSGRGMSPGGEGGIQRPPASRPRRTRAAGTARPGGRRAAPPAAVAPGPRAGTAAAAALAAAAAAAAAAPGAAPAAAPAPAAVPAPAASAAGPCRSCAHGAAWAARGANPAHAWGLGDGESNNSYIMMKNK